MDKNTLQNLIAKRAAHELQDGNLVNLGIGLPTLVANHISPNVNVTFHSENGFVGLSKTPPEGQEDRHLRNAGGQFVTLATNGSFFDSAMSFAIIRGGHVDVTILGALQVDASGNIANYMIPGKMVPGMGGAMDLLTGAKRVIVAMEHQNKGEPKILEQCTLPFTAANAVDLIITEMGVIEVTATGLVLIEINPKFSTDEVIAATAAKLHISQTLQPMNGLT